MTESTLYTGKSITETLAAELLAMICEYLPREDLICFRLTSKLCADVASKCLFRDLHVMFTKKSFENLLNVSKRPGLSKHVRSLYYEPRMLRDVEVSVFKSRVMSSVKGDDVTRQEAFEEEWKAYRRIIDSASFMKANCYDFFALAQALQNFQNLKCINVNSDGPDSHPAFHERFSTEDIYFEIYATAHDKEDVKSRALQTIITAVGLAGIELNTLIATVIPPSFFASVFNDGHNRVIQIAPHLKRMDISFSLDFLDRVSPPIASGIHNFLSPAVNLETLRVAMDPECLLEEDTVPAISWDSIIGSLVKLPKLQSLELCHMSGTHEYFSKFFEDHASTLQHLYLESLSLNGDISRWGNVFTTLQNLPLRTCKLEGDFWSGKLNETEDVYMFVSMDLDFFEICFERYPELSLLLKYFSKNENMLPSLNGLLEVLIDDAPEHAGLSTLTASRIWDIAVRQVKGEFRYYNALGNGSDVADPDSPAEVDIDDVTG
ncbi:hypothetical protein OCU04_008966 [Sclerotinia nivalis]|uniref:F-box domain-containing protein n=1 Tax=Sclerotinia nivalis TaxID=352851 RepID=A0A9X0AGN9_9HELO|nr:hypothetical protein OCU04_008966 [Sclerotinia nivalis]